MLILNHLDQIRNDFPSETGNGVPSDAHNQVVYPSVNEDIGRCVCGNSAWHNVEGVALCEDCAREVRSLKFQFNDGGRAAAGYQGNTGDCVTRAIAIATSKPYQEVYDAMWRGIRDHGAKHRKKRPSSPRNGVSRKVYQKYLESLGWKWFPTMAIGQGCKVHLIDGELPNGRLIVRVSKHVVAVIDGVIHDTFDDQRGGTRCVYGYYSQQDSSKTEFERAIDELMSAVCEAAQSVWKKYPYLTAKEVETAIWATVRPVCSEEHETARFVFEIARDRENG